MSLVEFERSRKSHPKVACDRLRVSEGAAVMRQGSCHRDEATLISVLYKAKPTQKARPTIPAFVSMWISG